MIGVLGLGKLWSFCRVRTQFWRWNNGSFFLGGGQLFHPLGGNIAHQLLLFALLPEGVGWFLIGLAAKDPDFPQPFQCTWKGIVPSGWILVAGTSCDAVGFSVLVPTLIWLRVKNIPSIRWAPRFRLKQSFHLNIALHLQLTWSYAAPGEGSSH